MKRHVQSSEEAIAHYRVVVKGVVQGVGFRPFVYHLAQHWGIKGSVLNSGRGVVIESEGRPQALAGFLRELKEKPPRLAEINDCRLLELPVCGYTSFQILASDSATAKEALIPPDVAICPDCAQEIRDQGDRHYRYPFTNCTNCGPRFTIIREVPYDRPQTSMAHFDMCDRCAGEYYDPTDRRFHAQPVACPACGPRVEVLDGAGKKVADKEDWLSACGELLAAGNILAVKGLGGYHLTCDAKNPAAVNTLRQRKGRDAKPFAVMCRDLDTVRKYCLAEEKELELLASPQAPVLILRKKVAPAPGLAEGLAPGLKTLGVMFPYTPLHLLLLNGPCDVLVMTSGNYSNLPLVKDNQRAMDELGAIADYFLQHNREIVNRCDDSLLRVIDGEPHFYRRSRGYVPHPVRVSRSGDGPVILGIGGEMKNNFCLLKQEQAFMSQYIGEIDSPAGEKNLLSSLEHLQKLTDAAPEIVAYDAHPGYLSAGVARQVPARSYVEIQHHHAHLASCMAENGLDNRPVIGAILDGTGYGPDGCLWGFEILTGDYVTFQRHFHLAYVPLPGGEAAIRQPWRAAVAYLLTFLGAEGAEYAATLFPDKNIALLEKMLHKGFNSPLSSGCGRFFDAVAAILGLCLRNTYEGQAAVELGELLPEPPDGGVGQLQPYPYELEADIINPAATLAAIKREQQAGLPAPTIARKFHHTLVDMVGRTVELTAAASGIRKVVLSGGTWQNPYLFRKVKEYLVARDLEVLYHRQVPTNDGGIALGQTLIAHWRWRKKCV